MTGGQRVAVGAMRYTPPTYSVDTFSPLSSVAVSRTPAMSRQDEELFRDLFAGDNDWEPPSIGSSSASRKQRPTKAPPLAWATGATMQQPFGPGAAPVRPSLAAPYPSANVQDLLNPRPMKATKEAEEDEEERTPASSAPPPWGRGLLSQLIEVGEEEEGAAGEDGEEGEEDGEGPEAPETTTEEIKRSGRHRPQQGPTRRRVVAPASPGLTLKTHSPAALHQETLGFLERLDLKALLCTPRPDVRAFYPPMPAMATATTTTTNLRPQIAALGGDGDRRVEEEEEEDGDSGGGRGPATGTGQGLSKAPSRPHPRSHALGESSGRLAHMAQLYGTTAAEPRKVRQETLTRLANPILGHSSTLQARREAHVDRAISEELLVPSAHNLYELALAQNAPTPALGKGAKATASNQNAPATTAAAAISRRRSNQDDEGEGEGLAPRSTAPRKTSKRRTKRHSERKAELKDRLAAKREQLPVEPSVMASTTGTFLTQHEESEARLTREAATSAHDDNVEPIVHVPQRPIIPPTVRARPVGAPTTTMAVTTGAASSKSRAGRLTRPTVSSGSKTARDGSERAAAAAPLSSGARRQPSTRPSRAPADASATTTTLNKSRRPPRSTSKPSTSVDPNPAACGGAGATTASSRGRGGRSSNRDGTTATPSSTATMMLMGGRAPSNQAGPSSGSKVITTGAATQSRRNGGRSTNARRVRGSAASGDSSRGPGGCHGTELPLLRRPQEAVTPRSGRVSGRRPRVRPAEGERA